MTSLAELFLSCARPLAPLTDQQQRSPFRVNSRQVRQWPGRLQEGRQRAALIGAQIETECFGVMGAPLCQFSR
jgi:hypothetical protein